MTRRIAVSDSTPLIALARIGELDLVRSVFSQIHVPEAVYDEVVQARDDAPGAREIAEASWIVQRAADRQLVRPLLLLVDVGEAEAIALAQVEADSILLTDDRKARRVATQLASRLRARWACSRGQSGAG